jgi:glycosyltransferase involved in cell wall biosynthesis
MRIAVHTDQAYWRHGDSIYAARAFVVFLGQLARSVDRLVVLGRLSPEQQRSHYRLADEIEFVPLPYHADASSPLQAAGSFAGSLRAFWRTLRDVDAVWLLGPYPLSLAYVLMALVRRKRVVLGVRQDMPQYIRNRRPGKRWIHVAGDLLEHAYRLLARRLPIVVVGPQLARNYAAAPRLLEISVSLVRDRDIVEPGELDRSYDGELRVVSVGRLDPEKNPLMLADVTAALRERDPRWKLVVCGDGPLEPELRRRLAELGVEQAVELKGHVPIDGGLVDVYRQGHFFLHVSWTEGLPQVLLEAMAAALPVVATSVGGVAEAIGGSALLIEPGDVGAAADSLSRLAQDSELRDGLVESGRDHVRRFTMDAECRRVAAFIAGSDGELVTGNGIPAAAQRTGSQ